MLDTASDLCHAQTHAVFTDGSYVQRVLHTVDLHIKSGLETAGVDPGFP